MDITAIANQQAGAVTLETDVCIAGSGPAGMVIGLFLAKQGMDVIVLEEGANFHQQLNHFTPFTKLVGKLESESGKNKKIKQAMHSLLLFVEEEKLEQLLFKPLYNQDGRMNRMIIMALYKQAEKLVNLTILPDFCVKGTLYKNNKAAGVFAESLAGEGYFIHSKLMLGTVSGQEEAMTCEQTETDSHLWMPETKQDGLSEVI